MCVWVNIKHLQFITLSLRQHHGGCRVGVLPLLQPFVAGVCLCVCVCVCVCTCVFATTRHSAQLLSGVCVCVCVSVCVWVSRWFSSVKAEMYGSQHWRHTPRRGMVYGKSPNVETKWCSQVTGAKIQQQDLPFIWRDRQRERSLVSNNSLPSQAYCQILHIGTLEDRLIFPPQHNMLICIHYLNTKKVPNDYLTSTILILDNTMRTKQSFS